mmetsp:Transcript_26027/g.30033  ORF Transcript_26027/g.30033 Transcript_26027/m.30033 type:complete len:224 (-) Transcript_26027:59-730(-)
MIYTSRESNDGSICSCDFDFGLADLNEKIFALSFIRNVERFSVHQLVLEEDNRVVISDGCFQQSSGVLGRVWCEHLQSWAMGVPSGEALGVLRSNSCARPIESSEHNRTVHISSGHVLDFCCGVDNVVDGLHREVKRHKLDNWSQAVESGSDTKPGEASFGNRRIDDSSLSVFLVQIFRYFVSSMVFSDLLAHEKNIRVSVHFLVHGGVDRISASHLLDRERS